MKALARIPSPEGRAKPPGSYLSWDAYMRDVEHDAHGEGLLECRRIEKAMRLAPTIAVFQALLHGEPVPVEQLDPEWAARYGL